MEHWASAGAELWNRTGRRQGKDLKFKIVMLNSHYSSAAGFLLKWHRLNMLQILPNLARNLHKQWEKDQDLFLDLRSIVHCCKYVLRNKNVTK